MIHVDYYRQESTLYSSFLSFQNVGNDAAISTTTTMIMDPITTIQDAESIVTTNAVSSSSLFWTNVVTAATGVNVDELVVKPSKFVQQQPQPPSQDSLSTLLSSSSITEMVV